MSGLHEALRAWFEDDERDDAKVHWRSKLYYGSDLAPGACERAIWYRLRGAPRKTLTLAERLLFEAGHRVEGMVVEAFEHVGALVAKQGEVRPLRPSAWCWSGRFDALVKAEHAGTTPVVPDDDSLVLEEVKTARSNAFKRRDAFPKDEHRWQASAYFHELRLRYPKLVRAELCYLDRDGANQPVVVPLTAENGKLVPLEDVIRQEEARAPLMFDATPLPALREDVVTTWRCNYCAFAETCKPEQHAAYTGERRPKAATAKRPRTPRKTTASASESDSWKQLPKLRQLSREEAAKVAHLCHTDGCSEPHRWAVRSMGTVVLVCERHYSIDFHGTDGEPSTERSTETSVVDTSATTTETRVESSSDDAPGMGGSPTDW